MEQTPALSMSPSTGSPLPDVPSTASPRLAEAFTPIPSPSPDNLAQERPSSPTETIRLSIETTPDSLIPRTTAERAFQHGLEPGNLQQEVGEVMGVFNSWWGGLKKQSVSAISSFKADLDKTMTQAQADLEHLRTAKIEVIRKSSETLNRPVENDKSEDTAGKGTEKKVESSANIAADHSSTVLPPSANAFLSRLTSSTSHLQNSIQQTFQSTLASASSNPAIANSSQLRAQLAENLRLSSATENLQVSMKQAEKLAEEYLRKGDQWVKDAEQWMGDAVKVVPPEGEETRHVGMSWDGSDWYSFSTSSKTPLGQFRQEGAEYAASARPARISMSGAGLAGSRKEALLRRLREDKELLMVDPSGEAESGERRDKFRKWVSDDWRRVKEDEREQQEGYVGGIRMALVPEHISDEQFWQRYLFHKHMIEAEEEKRKLLLTATQQSQHEDFSWDEDPEDSPSVTMLAATSPQVLAEEFRSSDTPTPRAVSENRLPQAPAVVLTAPPTIASASTSPRDSEESYDLVSDQGARAVRAAPSTEDEEYSDWE